MDRWFRGKSIFFILALIGILADLLTKSWAFSAIPPFGDRITVIPGFFYFERVENPGGVFGWFSSFGGWLAFVRGVALIVILVFLIRTEASRRLIIWALGFLFAGAFGNLYDNLFNDGKVRDFLAFYLYPPDRWHFPTFNIADVLINVAVGLLILDQFLTPQDPPKEEAKKSSQESPEGLP